MDLISRQAAIDALNQIFDRCEEIEAHLPKGDPDRTGYKMYPDYMIVWKYLHQLPSAEPERKTGGWIPCSERLPEKDGRYLCTVGAEYRNPREMIYAPQEWDEKSDDATWKDPSGYYVYDWFVKAWVPLPEPFVEDKNE